MPAACFPHSALRNPQSAFARVVPRVPSAFPVPTSAFRKAAPKGQGDTSPGQARHSCYTGKEKTKPPTLRPAWAAASRRPCPQVFPSPPSGMRGWPQAGRGNPSCLLPHSRDCGRGTSVPSPQAGGLPAISRWLSAATPPDHRPQKTFPTPAGVAAPLRFVFKPFGIHRFPELIGDYRLFCRTELPSLHSTEKRTY